MTSRRLEERRIAFQRYKDDVKREGKPFYPYAMFHDTVMSLVVVSVIVGLAFVWHYTDLLGPSLAAKADPGTTSFVPRPDWYFYFLFYLLRIFKWPESVILGTVGIPTILLIILIALPFLDLRRERRLLRRPVAVVAAGLTALSMGVLTYKDATAKESLATEDVQAVPTWAKREGVAGDAKAVAGRDRGAGDRALPQPAPLLRRDHGSVPRARRRDGDALPRAGLERAVRERLGQGGRLRDLPVLDGDAGHRGFRGDVQPDPSRR